MKLIVVVFIRMREASVSPRALPMRRNTALPAWTWFIENPRSLAGDDAAA